jgi:hypothetical protein
VGDVYRPRLVDLDDEDAPTQIAPPKRVRRQPVEQRI